LGWLLDQSEEGQAGAVTPSRHGKAVGETGTPLASEINDLERLSQDDLRLQWQATFGRAAPTRLSRNLLLSLFVYRLQATAHGDLSFGTIQLLNRLAQAKPGGEKTTSSATSPGGQRSLRPGTVLVRDHGRISHHVMVIEKGFSWNGQTYASLSQVAEAITGTKWNGPRFFGLRDGKTR
jgi:hypothetical protein